MCPGGFRGSTGSGCPCECCEHNKEPDGLQAAPRNLCERPGFRGTGPSWGSCLTWRPEARAWLRRQGAPVRAWREFATWRDALGAGVVATPQRWARTELPRRRDACRHGEGTRSSTRDAALARAVGHGPGARAGGAGGSDQGEPWSSGRGHGRAGKPSTGQPAAPGLQPTRDPEEAAAAPQTPAPEQTPETTGLLSPRVAWEVIPSRTMVPPPWDPSYPANARPQLLGASCGVGASFSGRTLYHPSWPMYDTWGWSPTSGQPSEEPAPGDTGLPVMCYQDVFFLDPLMHCGQRVPLYLSKPPQQAKGSLRLLLPPAVMSSSVHPSTSQAYSSTWLTEAEMIALTGLLQMSQGAPGPSSLAAPLTPASCPDPVSEYPGPSGSQSSSEGTDLCPPKTPDTHCS